VGTILPYIGDLTNLPRGWVLCNGTNGTPNLAGRFLEGTVNAPKSFKDAGLPNITGTIPTYTAAAYYPLASGAFSISFIDFKKYRTDPDSLDYFSVAQFNASQSNLIYGRSDTVQPASYSVYYIMRVK
jgi:hypothetical protein